MIELKDHIFVRRVSFGGGKAEFTEEVILEVRKDKLELFIQLTITFKSVRLRV